MAVNVYFWFPGIRNTVDAGHVSMKVTGGTPAGDMYISRWPSSTPAIFLGSTVSNQFAEDVSAEGGQPITVELKKLDETAIKKMIAVNLKSNLYSFFAMNCVTQVKLCLDEGVKGSTLINAGLSSVAPLTFVAARLTQYGLYAYVQALKATYG